MNEAQLGKARVKKLDYNSGIENVLETKKNLMEFVKLHVSLSLQKQLPSFSCTSWGFTALLKPLNGVFLFQFLDMESLVKFNKELANLVKFTLKKIISQFLCLKMAKFHPIKTPSQLKGRYANIIEELL